MFTTHALSGDLDQRFPRQAFRDLALLHHPDKGLESCNETLLGTHLRESPSCGSNMFQGFQSPTPVGHHTIQELAETKWWQRGLQVVDHKNWQKHLKTTMQRSHAKQHAMQSSMPCNNLPRDRVLFIWISDADPLLPDPCGGLLGLPLRATDDQRMLILGPDRSAADDMTLLALDVGHLGLGVPTWEIMEQFHGNHENLHIMGCPGTEPWKCHGKSWKCQSNVVKHVMVPEILMLHEPAPDGSLPPKQWQRT